MTVDLPRFALSLGLLLAAAPALALDLAMPAPVSGLLTRTEVLAGLTLPTGPFANGALPARRVEGTLDQRAWQLDAKGMTLSQLASPLRAQLEAQGFVILLDCETRACGGFDFRLAIDVMPEPEMHVDLGDFRFLSAEKGDEVVALLVSRSPSYGFVQLTRVGALALPDAAPVLPAAPVAPLTAAPLPADPAPAPADAVPAVPGDLLAQMEGTGGVALDDLVFGSGSAELQDGDYASLAALAGWLAADPARSIALVGHTNSSGALAGNVALSKKRAAAVRRMLLLRHDADPGQITAEGVGPLAPRADNQTEDGRTKNRRVEAVITSTQ